MAENSEKGGEQPPAEDQSSRRAAKEILSRATENGRGELERPVLQLGISGIAGGLTMGLTGLIVAVVQSLLGAGGNGEFLAYLFYPVGFIAVIVGRQQLFTENTLYPVVVVLDEHRYLWRTVRLWAIVFFTNIFGAYLFALLAERVPSLPLDAARQLATLGASAVGVTASHAFWSGVIGGWIIALVAWLVTASQYTIGLFAVTWLLTFLVGYGKFAHCIASSGEILAAVVAGSVTAGRYFAWLLPAALGNIAGGVIIVSVLNWAQVTDQIDAETE